MTAGSPRIALLTCADWPSLPDDDRLLYEPLRQMGISADAVCWDDPALDAGAFDLMVIRSTWDYSLRVEELRTFLSSADNLWNPARVIEWNLDKRYLRELAAAGASVVETEWLEDSRTAVSDVVAARGWERAVVKPAISAGARDTHLIERGDVSLDEIMRPIARDRGVMVQPFLEALVADGEWSFVFFAGELSHAVLKRPGDGDFRVQEHLGGTAVTVADPPPRLVAQAAAILAHAPGDLLYARVDGVAIGGSFVLLELEVFEPSLFLDRSAGAPDRFARAIAAKLG